ncbi:MAG: efflux RND transporter periplasmic adaptor subunit [Rhodobacteraceae bacterium]|nr:efflux RND transporter periplasmic adaptor subunit [Paracoccaceae bacterium]
MTEVAQHPTAAPVTAPVTAPAAPPRARHRRGRRLGWLVPVLILAGGTAWWLTRPAAPVTYVTAAADRGAVTSTISATGTVNPVVTVTVGSYVSGVIAQVLCDFNDTVTQGQVCARIDDRTFRTTVAQAQSDLDLARAQLAKDQAGLDYAQANYDRNLQMVKTSTVSQDAVDLAKSSFQQAQAQLQVDQATIEQKQAALDAANINLDYTQIKSPVAGTVILRNVTAGQTVASSLTTPTLFLIAQDLTQMQVDVNVSESDIGQVKAGEDASFSVNAYPARVFTGKVKEVRQSPQSVQNVITYDVVVAVANADLALRPGMTASAKIVVDQRADVLRVPSKALRYQPSTVVAGTTGRPAGTGQGTAASTEASPGTRGRLWVLRDGKPVPVFVHSGLDDGTNTEILSGKLAAGDAVILGESSASRSGGSSGGSARGSALRFRP